MPQLATATDAVSVPLSCPLYLDFGSGSPPHQVEPNFGKANFSDSKGLLDVSFLYENLLKNQSNMSHLNHNLFAESVNYYLNQSYRNGDKTVSLKSFSIESILGFPATAAAASSPSKELFYHPLSLSPEFSDKHPHYQTAVGEFSSKGSYYTSLASDRLKAQLTNNEHVSNGCAQIESKIAAGSLKSFHVPTLSRKSNKLFKASVKASNNQLKSKRVRTIFTPEQLERLETEFEQQQYMVGTGRHYLASTLNLTEAQVKVWFQNRRIKWRKQHLEGQERTSDKPEKCDL